MRRSFPVFKSIFALVALAVVAAATLHVYVTRQVERELASLASQVSPVGSLEWGSVALDLSGQLRIRDIGFQPHMVAGQVRIGQLAFTAPNLIELLQATREFDKGRLPASLGLSIRSLQIPIEGSGMERMDLPASSGLPFEAAGCDGRETLRISDLPHMDIWNLVSDITLDYRLLNNGERMTLRVGNHTQYLAGLTLDARLHLGSASRDLDLLGRAWAMARLEEVELTYLDLGLRHRLDRFCAGELGLTVEQFRNQHMVAWTAAWGHYGLAPSPEVVNAYRQFVSDPQVIEALLTPTHRLPLTAFTRLERTELLKQLELSLRINQGATAQVGFEAVPVTTRAVKHGIRAGGEPEESTDQEDVVRRIGWVEIPMTQVSNHLGQRIRMTTTAGDRISGELVEVDAEHLHLRIRGVGGFHVRPFLRARVSAVEIRN
jgi:hypothetical protein